MLLGLVPLLLLGACARQQPPPLPQERISPVPDVVGERVEQARTSLEQEGLLVQIVEREIPPTDEARTAPPGRCADGTVVSQDPPPNEEFVVRGSTFVLKVEDC